MNPLLKKEIRLILPAWGITLLLVVAPHILFQNNHDQFDFMAPVWLGILILCASSFGREFSLGTFSSLLALPVPRKQFWFIKLSVLVAALVSVLLVFFISLGLFHALVAGPNEGPSALTLGLFLLTAIAGGLWLALLIRQTIAVVWLIVLVPFLLCLPLLFLLTHFNAGDQTVETTIDAALLVYSVAGIAGSWLIFQRAQDAPWSGGTINLPDWMSAGIMQRSGTDERHQVPWRALIRKEFQFNQVPLLGMGVLFLVHLAVVGLRFFHRNPDPTDVFWRDMNATLQAIGFLWVIPPLILGCSSIAEERKLGTMEGQLCQPVSARRQFLVKFGFTLVVGGLFSAALLFLGEGIGFAVGAAPYNHSKDAADILRGSGMGSITAALLAVAIIGFFASSLTRNLLQALPAAIALAVGTGLVLAGFEQLSGFDSFSLIRGFKLWNPFLPGVILAALLTPTLPWLAYRNFRCLHESARIWRRNGLALLLVLVLTAAVSVAFYHRIWEKFTPIEPAHDAASLTLKQLAPAIRTGQNNNLQISLPDGRTWFGCVANQGLESGGEPGSGLAGWCRRLLNCPLPPRLSGVQFIPGTGWSSLAAGYVDVWFDEADTSVSGQNSHRYQHFTGGRETVGIQADGTLWVSAKFGQDGQSTSPLVQYGSETNWQEVVDQQSATAVLLLKKDGTLWRWGEPTNSWYKVPATWPGLRAFPPRQIGTATNWQGLTRVAELLAQKTDGSIWHVSYNYRKHQEDIFPNTNFDAAGFTHQRLEDTRLSLAYFGNQMWAGIRADGTLWFGGRLYWDPAHNNSTEALQSGHETNWAAAVVGGQTMVALKSDGTLWQWDNQYNWYFRQPADEFTLPPVRLGIHHDWVALAQVQQGVVSLAADGSLWLWPDISSFDSPRVLVEPSEKPVLLGNVLAAN